jgi:hypothetical protein
MAANRQTGTITLPMYPNTAFQAARENTLSVIPVSVQDPEFDFKLKRNGTDLALQWDIRYAQACSFTINIKNGMGGYGWDSPSTFTGNTLSGLINLGRYVVARYEIAGSVTCTDLSGQVRTWSIPSNAIKIAAQSMSPPGLAVTSSSHIFSELLPELTPINSISFPDVNLTAKTVTYKGQNKGTRVSAVNAARMDSIKWLASRGVTAGSGAEKGSNRTTFRPQDTVNRGAMAQFLQKLGGFSDAQIAQIYQGKSTKFTDIGNFRQSNPARYYAIFWLADTGITAGCNAEGTKFCPANTVNRGAMAEFMRKFVGIKATPAANSPFPDVNLTAKTLKYDGSNKAVRVSAVNAARMGAINWMRTTGITAGSGAIGGRIAYRPQDPVNRGAMAQFMHKLSYQLGSTNYSAK